jgi:Tfp pilus assembly protein PilN
MKTIGIHINKNAVSIAQLSSKNGRFTLEHSASLQVESETQSAEITETRSVSEGIKSLLSQSNFDKKAKTAINAPANEIYYQPFTTDIRNTEDIQQLIKFQMEEDFPIPFDQLITAICSKRQTNDNQCQFLITAINRQQLRKAIEPLSDLDIQTPAVTSDAVALAALMSLDESFAESDNSMIIHADSSNIILTICEKGSPIYIRHLSCEDLKDKQNNSDAIDNAKLMREIDITLLAAFAKKIPADLKFFITEKSIPAKNLCEKLNQSTSYQSTMINPLESIDCPNKTENTNNDIIIAASLAIIATGKTQNQAILIDSEFTNADNTAEIKRGVFAFAALLVIIVSLLTVKIFYRKSTLENKNKTLNLEIRNIFNQTLPAEKNIVDELAQLTEKLGQLQTEHDQLSNALNNKVSPLKTLRQISVATPNKNIIIDDISITPTKTKLSGTAPSFDSVDKLLNAIKKLPGFENAKPHNINAIPQQNRVRFSISTTLESTK